MFIFLYILGMLFLVPFSRKYLNNIEILVFSLIYSVLSLIPLIFFNSFPKLILFSMILIYLLIAMTISDYATMNVSTILLIGFAIWAIFYSFYTPIYFPLEQRLLSASLYGLPLSFYVYFKKNAFGEADIIFITISAFILGYYLEAIALLLSCITAILFYFYQKKLGNLNFHTAFAFLPFLSFSFCVIFFYFLQENL